MKKKLLSRFSSMKGFTMIELLVVIAIIGVLAVAVLSAINPIEQINKGRDTRTRSDAGELLSGIERYYTTQEMFPWNTNSTAVEGTTITAYEVQAGSDTTEEAFSVGTEDNSDWAWLGNLVNSQEVKTQFGVRLFNAYNNDVADVPEFILVKNVDSDQPRVCFIPTSNQFKLEATRKCCPVGNTSGVCSGENQLAGSTEGTVGGVAICSTTYGDVSETNYICLP